MAVSERWEVRFFSKRRETSFVPQRDKSGPSLTLDQFHRKTRSYFNPETAAGIRDPQLSIRVFPRDLVSLGDRVIEIAERTYQEKGGEKYEKVNYSPSTIDLFHSPEGRFRKGDDDKTTRLERGQYLINVPDSLSTMLPYIRIGWVGSHPYIESDSTGRLSFSMSACTPSDRGVTRVGAEMFHLLQSVRGANFSPTTPLALTLRVGGPKMPVLASIIYPEGGKADYFDVIVNPAGLRRMVKLAGSL